MNDEPGDVNVVGADKTVKVATQSPHNSKRTRRSSRNSTSETSTLSISSKDNPQKCRRKQESTDTTSTSGSTNQTMDGSAKEGEQRNTNTSRLSRNHFTRSRTPRSSPPHKTKSEGQSKSVGFHLHCIDAITSAAPCPHTTHIIVCYVCMLIYALYTNN
jgi:hypothetical protein